MALDLEGNVLSFVEAGASSFHKDVNAKRNVRGAIADAIAKAGCSPRDVRAVVAGIAGYDSEGDLEWVEPLTDVEGLICLRRHFNDAVVAHSGALMSEPGIIVICGTGSIIFAVTEDGRYIRNYDMHHYAAGAARFLAYDAVYELLAGFTDHSDEELVAVMLRSLGISSVDALRERALNGFIPEPRERDKAFGSLAPAITAAALSGSRLARTVCDRAVHQIVVGVSMLGAYFNKDVPVKVALIGSVANSPYMKRRISERLAAGAVPRYELKDPRFSPVAGAVLLALKEAGVPVTDQVLRNMSAHPGAGT
jgi:glucosamine kinase